MSDTVFTCTKCRAHGFISDLNTDNPDGACLCNACFEEQTKTPKDERTWRKIGQEWKDGLCFEKWSTDGSTYSLYPQAILHTHQAALAEEMVKEIEELAVEEQLPNRTWKKHTHLVFKADTLAIIRRHLTPTNPTS